MTLEPQNDYLIIKKIERDAIAESGIILPDSGEDVSVIWLGEIRFSSNPEYVIRDQVLFSRYLPFEFEANKEKFIALKAQDVIAKVS